MNSFFENILAAWASYRRMPAWVQIWVGVILFPTNAVSFFLLDTWFGYYAAWAAGFVFFTNMPIMYACRGMSRLMAVPHLFGWIPLEILGILRFFEMVGPLPTTAVEITFIVLIVLVNGVSLIFDIHDTKRWMQGERQIP